MRLSVAIGGLSLGTVGRNLATSSSGLASPLRAAAPDAFETAYRDGLMAFRKHSAPPIRDGVHGDDGPLRGAVARGVDHLTTEAALDRWARHVTG